MTPYYVDLNSVYDDRVGTLAPPGSPIPVVGDVVTITDDGDLWDGEVLRVTPENRWFEVRINWQTWRDG